MDIPQLLGSLGRHFLTHVSGRTEVYFWLWLAGAMFAVDFLYRVANRPAAEPFWKYATPQKIFTHPSAILDYKYVVLNRLVVLFAVAPLLLSSVVTGGWVSGLLTALFGSGPGWTAGPAGYLTFAVIGVVLLDAGQYLSHYLQHKIPFFWEFHKIHHAAEVLTPVTAFRVHPVENILDAVVQAPMQGLAIGLYGYLYGGPGSVVSLVWLATIFPLNYLVGSLRHTHIWVSFGPVLEHIFSSPAQHQIHHSRAPQHIDTNFSRYFSFFDWFAGTLYIPRGPEELQFGLTEGPDPELASVRSLYWVPLKRAYQRLRPSAQAVLPHGAAPARSAVE